MDKTIDISAACTIHRYSRRFVNNDWKNGVNCKCNFILYQERNELTNRLDKLGQLSWDFDWIKAEMKDVEEFVGYIEMSWREGTGEKKSERFDVRITQSGQNIKKKVDVCWNDKRTSDTVLLSYKLHLKPVSSKQEEIDAKFAEPSDKTDAILVVEGKKMHVNKAILCYHSDFFDRLFNSNFKEKTMSEIPIEDVAHSDFTQLLGIIHHEPNFPSVKSAGKLLELADRFMIPAVTRSVENFLNHGSWKRMRTSQALYLADRFKMESLLGKCIGLFKTRKDIEDVTNSAEFQNISDGTKVKLFHCLLAANKEEDAANRKRALEVAQQEMESAAKTPKLGE